jgi:hypothetical protein
MNFALPAVIIFLLVLPGFIFRSKLKIVERTSLDYSPFGLVVSEGIFFAFLLHLICLLISYYLFDRMLQVDILLRFLAAETSSRSQDISIIAADIGPIVMYCIGIMLAAWAIPTALRWTIVRFKLDRFGGAFSGLFRFHGAPWYYTLSSADFPEDMKDRPDAISVAGVVTVGGNSYVYQGFLDEYFLDEQGQLDRLVLKQAERRLLADDKYLPEKSALDNGLQEIASPFTSRFYPIEGEYFVLRYSEITTLNIRYVKFSDDTAPEVAAQS